MVTQRLLDMYRPSAVIFTGLAGALNPELNIGDIVIGIDAVQYDMDVTVMNFKRGEIPFTGIKEVYSDQQLIKAAEEAAETAWGINFLKKHSIYKGRILTGDRFISRGIDDPDYFVFRNSLVGDAVEMEGAAVGLVAFSNGIPFLLIRTISDRADSNAKKDFSRIMKRASRNSFYFVSHVIKNIPEHIIK